MDFQLAPSAVVALPGRRGRKRSSLRVGAAAAAALVVVVGAVANAPLLLEAPRALTSLSLHSVAVLLGLVAIHRLVNALGHRAVVRTVPLRRLMAIAEVHTGTSHTMVGGAGVGTGLRAAMLRTAGVSPVDVSVALAIGTLVPVSAMWLLACAHAGFAVATGNADRSVTGIAVASLLVLGAGAAAGRWVTTSPRAALASRRLLLRGIVAIESRATRLPGLQRRCSQLRSGATTMAESLQKELRETVRNEGPFVLLAAAIAQIVLALLFVACVAAVAPRSTLPLLALLRTFALLRVASSFVPVPGGLGVVDVGLISALHSAGVSHSAAIASVGLYRVLTFILPMVSGPLCAAGCWRAPKKLP